MAKRRAERTGNGEEVICAALAENPVALRKKRERIEIRATPTSVWTGDSHEHS